MTVVYEIYDEDGRLLYVGVTDDFERRMRQHAHTKWWWNPDQQHSIVFEYPNRGEALRVEAETIRSQRPVYNLALVRPEDAYLRRVTYRLRRLCRWYREGDNPFICTEADVLDTLEWPPEDDEPRFSTREVAEMLAAALGEPRWHLWESEANA